MKRRSTGFTLIELAVSISIIGILSAIVYANFNDGRAQSRDAQRKADLRNLQSALELYKNEEGRYPEGCAASLGGGWSGQVGTKFECDDGSGDYIVGLAPKYIPVLPSDPRLSASESNGYLSNDSGYVYLTNTNGTVYKLVVRNTVETESFFSYNTGYEYDFKACDVIMDPLDDSLDVATAAETDLPIEGTKYALGSCNYENITAACTKGFNDSNYKQVGTIRDCRLENMRNSYAVWGGYGDPADIGGTHTDENKVECLTEEIICRMPAPLY